MKKTLACLLILGLLLTATGCRWIKNQRVESGTEEQTPETSSETSASDETETTGESKESEPSETTETEEPSETTEMTTESVPETVKSTEPVVAPPAPQVSPSVSVGEKVVVEELPPDAPPAPAQNQTPVASVHTALPESRYYQFGTLSGNEQNVYREIVNAVRSFKGVVDIWKYELPEARVVAVFQKVIADYPQFFFVSRNCMLAYSPSGAVVRAIVLLYTDGSVTDRYDERLRITQTANRNTINARIATLNNTVSGILATVPAGVSETEKEKLLHDYVLNNVTYDNAAASSASASVETLPSAFDLYGAVVEHRAVCEGYTKMLQYLCYNVGILSTPVVGRIGDAGHMWNAVFTDGIWYQTDATWDDMSPGRYRFFNRSEAVMTQDHVIDRSTLAVPPCTVDSK